MSVVNIAKANSFVEAGVGNVNTKEIPTLANGVKQDSFEVDKAAAWNVQANIGEPWYCGGNASVRAERNCLRCVSANTCGIKCRIPRKMSESYRT